ncbi:Sestrin like protein [Melipona quadrifasciata]|uniref:Sestrin like protein n=1 Tax=Melipona quadrifasciata TaxID=166423 RepID=A0A0M8ZXF8_9HYME|nr:Sestrin like protein [Melipona quadrifasciata]
MKQGLHTYLEQWYNYKSNLQSSNDHSEESEKFYFEQIVVTRSNTIAAIFRFESQGNSPRSTVVFRAVVAGDRTLQQGNLLIIHLTKKFESFRTHILLMDAFLQNNRLDHVSRVMASHPSYLEHFLRTQHFILRGDGPLPYDYRHLIAIMSAVCIVAFVRKMCPSVQSFNQQKCIVAKLSESPCIHAAGRHQCSYLINLQKGEFILQGGDPSWLRGLKSIPGKLQDLYEINKILAHRPWLLNKTHIEKLTKGADSWSLAEVVHAIVLLAHFHSLSSFVFSCGINEELDNVAGHHYKENIQDNSNNVPTAKDKLSSSPKKIPNGDGKTENMPSPPSSPSIVGEQEVGVEALMERMKRLSEKSESYQITQEELSKRFETVETQSAELAAAPQRSSSVLDSDIGHFIEDPTFIYQDFAKQYIGIIREADSKVRFQGDVSSPPMNIFFLNDIPTFRVQDYSWDDHGYSLVNRLYNDVGNLLDDKFKTAYNLTYYTMGTHSKVDTSRFRRAIWNYIQCMFGIRHDDYDYNEVNQLLERSLKTFIKSAVCYPERVTKRDYDRVMREFKHSEKVGSGLTSILSFLNHQWSDSEFLCRTRTFENVIKKTLKNLDFIPKNMEHTIKLVPRFIEISRNITASLLKNLPPFD